MSALTSEFGVLREEIVANTIDVLSVVDSSALAAEHKKAAVKNVVRDPATIPCSDTDDICVPTVKSLNVPCPILVNFSCDPPNNRAITQSLVTFDNDQQKYVPLLIPAGSILLDMVVKIKKNSDTFSCNDPNNPSCNRSSGCCIDSSLRFVLGFFDVLHSKANAPGFISQDWACQLAQWITYGNFYITGQFLNCYKQIWFPIGNVLTPRFDCNGANIPDQNSELGTTFALQQAIYKLCVPCGLTGQIPSTMCTWGANAGIPSEWIPVITVLRGTLNCDDLCFCIRYIPYNCQTTPPPPGACPPATDYGL